MTARSLVSLQGVRKSFGDGVTVEVLHGIDLEIAEGELVALVGPSGSGKSTLLNQIGLLDRPTHGVIRLLGQDVSKLDDSAITRLRGRSLGFIFQFHHLLPGLSVLENVVLPSAVVAGRFDASLEPKGQAVLEAVGLGDRVHSRPGELSGGMQQRVAVARALMNDPALVLADEPTGNLDTETGDQVFDLLTKSNKELRTAFLIVTHDDAIASRCRRVVRLVDGQVVADGDPSEVLGKRPP